MQLVLLLSQSRHIDVVETMQADGAIQPLWSDVVDNNGESLWSPEPVLNRKQLRVGRLARDVLCNSGHWFRSFCCAHDVVEQSRAVRLREEDGAMVFILLCRHLHGVVRQLVMAVVVGINTECVWARPLFPVDDRMQDPGGVGPVVDGQIPHLFGPHIGSKVKHLSIEKKNLHCRGRIDCYTEFSIRSISSRQKCAYICILLH